VDAAYTYQSNDPAEQPGSLLNYFDDTQSSFGVKQAGLTVSSLPKEGFGALVNITAGSDADFIHSNGGSDSSNFDLTQAYVQYATGPFTAMAGKFNTLAGAEVIAPTGNTNISRSIAFLWALPFTHTGVRLAYVPMDTLTLYAGINNGWDQQDDLNSDKTVELGAIWAPASMVTVAASVYNGKEPISATEDTDRFLFDTVITVKPTDSLSLVLNYDYGKQEDAATDGDDAKWSAIVGYVNYQIDPKWRLSLRGEVFDDKDGARMALADLDPSSSSFGELSEKSKEVTLTVGYAATANFELRGEVRQDFTEEEAFVDGDSTKDSNTYVAVEALYKF
jgi:predicted porin